MIKPRLSGLRGVGSDWIKWILILGLSALSWPLCGQEGQEGQEQCGWDSGFHARGLNHRVMASVTFDDGTGPALYVGGWFTTADDKTVHHVAKWDGNQ